MPEPEIREAIVVKPGDHLIVRVDVCTSRSEFDQLRTALEGRFPQLEVTVIAAEQIAVVRDA